MTYHVLPNLSQRPYVAMALNTNMGAAKLLICILRIVGNYNLMEFVNVKYDEQPRHHIRLARNKEVAKNT